MGGYFCDARCFRVRQWPVVEELWLCFGIDLVFLGRLREW